MSLLILRRVLECELAFLLLGSNIHCLKEEGFVLAQSLRDFSASPLPPRQKQYGKWGCCLHHSWEQKISQAEGTRTVMGGLTQRKTCTLLISWLQSSQWSWSRSSATKTWCIPFLERHKIKMCWLTFSQSIRTKFQSNSTVYLCPLTVSFCPLFPSV